MRRSVLALGLFCLCALAADKKPPDIRILEISARRDGGKLLIDGQFRVTGDKPIRNMKLTLDFLAEGHSSVSTKQFEVDEPVLYPGDESEFHVAASAPPRAVEFRIRAYGEGSRQLSVENPGPHPIQD